MYRSAHVYFSSTLPPELLVELRSTPGLSTHLETLREAHIEFSVVDRRTFHTNQVCHVSTAGEAAHEVTELAEGAYGRLRCSAHTQERALQHLFGDDTAGHSDSYQMEVHTAARRVVSLLVSLKVCEITSMHTRVGQNVPGADDSVRLSTQGNKW